MKLNQKILKAINEGIRKSLLSFDDVQFDQTKSNSTNKNVSSTIGDWKFIQDNFVDFDLPSGTLWCKYNLGASKPEEFGNFYAWGEIEQKQDYSWNTYKYGTDEDDIMKYTSDGYPTLQLEDDAAHNTNSLMTIPTLEQIKELLKYTYNIWIVSKGVEGRLFVSRKDETKSIFVPAAGFHSEDEHFSDESCHVWSKTGICEYQHCSQALYLDCSSTRVEIYADARYLGYTIRPVSQKQNNE